MAKSKKETKEEFKISGDRIVKKLKEILKEGNVRRVIISDGEGKKLLEIPVTFAVIGALAAPILAAVGALAALVTECTITVIRRD